MTAYSGICVGGPMDGMAFCHKAKHFEVPIFDENRLSVDMKEIRKNIEYEIHEYKYVIGLRGTFYMDFWANEKEFPSLEKIICHIFSEYCTRERSR